MHRGVRLDREGMYKGGNGPFRGVESRKARRFVDSLRSGPGGGEGIYGRCLDRVKDEPMAALLYYGGA